MRELAPGEILLGKYEIIKVLGSGGMGAVYQGRQIDLNRDVAIKVPHRDALAIPGFTQRFAREAKTVAKLVHDNVVQVYEFHQSENDLFIVMEFVEGKDLQAMVKNPTNDLKVSDFAKMLTGAAQGLAYAHEFGVIHRDIKPHNVMVGRVGGKAGRWRVKIMDFGIAHIDQGAQFTEVQQLTITGQAIGTPSYMSPEQVRGMGVTHLSDIYSLGCVLFFVFSRRTPFVGTGYTIAAAHLGEPAPSMHQFLMNVPEEYDLLVRQCLEKDPSLRPQDCNEIAERIMSSLAPVMDLPMSAIWATLAKTPALLQQEEHQGDPGSEGTPLNIATKPGAQPQQQSPPLGRTEIIDNESMPTQAADPTAILKQGPGQATQASPGAAPPPKRVSPQQQRPAAPYGVSPEVASLVVAAQHHDQAKPAAEEAAKKRSGRSPMQVVILSFVAVILLIGVGIGIAYAVKPDETKKALAGVAHQVDDLFYSNVEFDKAIRITGPDGVTEGVVWPDGTDGYIVDVAAHRRVNWTASVDNAEMLQIIEPPAELSGEAKLTIKVARNTGPGREGRLKIASADATTEFLFTQQSGCKVEVPDSSKVAELAAGGEGKPTPATSFAVKAGDTCTWKAIVDPRSPWLRVASGVDNVGPVEVRLEADPNPGDTRQAKLTIRDDAGKEKALVITQAPGQCSVFLDTRGTSFPPTASGTFIFAINASSTRCKWRLELPNWMVRATEPTADGGFDLGTQEIHCVIQPNTVPANRSGRVVIKDPDGKELAGVDVTQRGVFLLKGISPRNQEITSQMSGGFDVDADVGCEWSVSIEAGADWVVIEKGDKGVGPGRVEFKIVELNQKGGRRFARFNVSSPDQKPIQFTLAQGKVE